MFSIIFVIYQVSSLLITCIIPNRAPSLPHEWIFRRWWCKPQRLFLALLIVVVIVLHLLYPVTIQIPPVLQMPVVHHLVILHIQLMLLQVVQQLVLLLVLQVVHVVVLLHLVQHRSLRVSWLGVTWCMWPRADHLPEVVVLYSSPSWNMKISHLLQ